MSGVSLKAAEATFAQLSFSQKVRLTTAMLKEQALAWLATPMGMATVAVTGISLLASGISWVNQKLEENKQKLKEVAQEASKQADESAKAVSALSDLKTQLTSGTKSSNELTSAFKEQLKAMGYTEGQIDALINKYGGLSGAIDEATRKALENARTDAHTDVATSSKSLETTYDPHGMSGDTKSTVQLTEFDPLRDEILEIMKPVAIDTDSLMSTITMGANSDSAEDIYAYYQGLQQVVQLIQDTASKTNNKELLNSSVYKEASETLQELGESAKLYGDAIDRLNNADAKIELANFLKTNDIATQEDFDAYIKGVQDGTIGMVDGKEASDTYKQVLIDVANDAFPQFSNAAKEAGKNANEMTVSIGDLEKASDKIKTLGSAFKELSDDGHITTKTLGEIKTATELADDEWKSYENTLLGAKKGSTEFNQAMSDLTYKVLENQLGTDKLANSDEAYIVAILRENGVLNANVVAQDMITQAKHKQEIQSILTKDATDEEISSLISNAQACGTAKNAYLELVAKEILFNNNDLDVSDKVDKLNKIAVAAGVAGIEMDKLNSKLSGVWGNDRKSYAESYGIEVVKAGMTTNGKGQQVENWQYKYNGETYEELSDAIGVAEAGKLVDKISSSFNGINVNYGGNTSSSSSSSYEDPTDAIINRINLRSKELEQQEEQIENAIEIAELENDYKKQISLTNDLITNRKKRVEELNKANAALHNEAEYLRNINPWDEESWFNSQGEATEAYYSVYNSASTKEQQEQIKDLFESLSKYKKSYTDNAKEILDLNKQILKDEEQLADLSYSNSERWINERNTYNDWELYDDNEIAAWERVLKRFKTEFPNELEKIKDIEQKIYEARKEAMEKSIDDIEDYIDARNHFNDWEAYGDSEVKAIRRQTKIIEKAYRDRLLSYEEYVDRLEEQHQRLYTLAQDEVDKHLSNIDKYIDARNHYNDWDDFNDSEIQAIKRQCAILDEAYRLNLISLEEYTEKSEKYNQRLYSTAKNNIVETISKLVEDYEEMRQLESSRLESQKTLLQSYYDVTNAVAEAQHEINKELQASQSMYEYLNEETRELLFNQGDYNTLSKELLDIQSAADELQKQYQEDILNANAETIAEITSQYQMQYETMMKQYEIAKAELEVAKKRQKLDNVLAERNTRMFINGQWQWVAKTQDVINAQNELAEAEIERKKQEASLEQTEAINKFTEQINNIETDLKQIRKKWADMQEMLEGESDEVAKVLKEISQVSSPELQRVIEVTGGSIESFSLSLSESTETMSTIIDTNLGNMSTGIDDIVKDLENYSKAIKNLVDKINDLDIDEEIDEEDEDEDDDSDSKGNSSSIVNIDVVAGDIIPNGAVVTVSPFPTTTSSSKGSSKKVNTTDQYVKGSNGNVQSNPNWDGKKTGGVGSFYKYAEGTRYTAGGLTLMGEEGEELYIPANGRLIPINQPTIGNIGAGGVVFNREQMASVRNLWDLSNLGKVSPFVSSSSMNRQDTIIDNSIHINGLTVGEQGNEDWINGLRRYVATHK